MSSNAAKSFDILTTSVLYYFDNPTKLFSNLYLSQFISTKSFFLCNV